MVGGWGRKKSPNFVLVNGDIIHIIELESPKETPAEERMETEVNPNRGKKIPGHRYVFR
jgi:hypothetical protein